LQRPRENTGVFSWFTTVDHKKIGILYGVTALAFFVIGGIEALLIRVQLWGPERHRPHREPVQPDLHDARHDMVFLMGMPLSIAFGNYLIPLMIARRGCRVPAHQHVRVLGVPAGRCVLYSSFVLGGAPNGGWFGYAPLTSTPISKGFLPGHGPDSGPSA